MSVVYTYVLPGVDLAQLHDELLRAGLVPELVQFQVVTLPDPAPPPPPAAPTNTYADTVTLTMPDGTVKAAVDAVVAAHVPMARYNPATQLAQIAQARGQSRLLADYVRLQEEVDAMRTMKDVKQLAQHLLEVLQRRDRAMGLY